MVANKAPFKKKANTRSHIPGERIHSDLIELPTLSTQGYRYLICFIDDATRRGMSYAMKTKDEALAKWTRFLEEEILPTGKRVKYFRSDNGGEYCGEFRTYNNVRGIQAEYAPPYCQSGNGVAEVYWRVTFNTLRTILHDQQRPDSWWPLAHAFANHIRNHTMTTSLPDVPPEVAWTGKPVDLSIFRVPLCDAYAYTDKENRRDKLDKRRMQGVFVGYASDSNCYRIMDVDTNMVYNRRYQDVKFVENRRINTHASIQHTNIADVVLAQREIDAAIVREATTKIHEKPPTMMVTTKVRSVAELAAFFNTTPEKYLAFIQAQGGWYQQLTSTKDKVKRNWTVPVYVPPAPTYQTDEKIPSPPNHPATAPTSLTPTYVPAPTPPKTQPPNQNTLTRPTPPTDAPPLKRGRGRPRKGERPTPSAKRQRRERAHSMRTRAHAEVPAYTATDVETKLKTAMNKGVRMYLDQARANKEYKDMQAALAQQAQEQAELQKELEFLHLTALLADATTHTKATFEPKSHRSAMVCEENEKWKGAEKKELDGLEEKHTWDVCDITPNMKLHKLLWVYKVKANGTYKARLCLDGRHQDPTTYDAIRSPTMRLTSFRLLLAMAAQKGWHLTADDATQAFLNAHRPADKAMYATMPEGYEQAGKCLLLKRCLYGAHDSPLMWFRLVRKHLTEEQGLLQSATDECLFYSPANDLFVVVHVDDFCATGTSQKLQAFRKQLHAKFKMTGGKLDVFYGLNVNTTDKHHIKLTCKDYMERTMRRLGLNDAPRRKYTTPMDPNLKLPHLKGECTDKKLHKQYRSLVGCIMHPATTCRPDVAAAVRELSSHLQHPTVQHVKAAERVLYYLYHTREEGLNYNFPRNATIANTFFGTCDAAHNVTHNSRGITGYSYHAGQGAVAWKSRAQDIVALSSTEAELIAVDEAVRELRFLHKLLQDFGINVSDSPTTIGQDNMSCITLCKGKHFNARTKHCALRFHHVSEQQEKNICKLVYMPTDVIPSDLLTKALPKASHIRHMATILGNTFFNWKTYSDITKDRHPTKKVGF